MVFSRSYTLLRLSYQKTGRTTNLILENSLKRTKPFVLFSTNIPKDETPKEISKQCLSPVPVTCKNADHIDRLKHDTSTNDVINNGDSNNEQKLSNKSNDLFNSEIFTKNASDSTSALEDSNKDPLGLLSPCNEDLSHIGPYQTPTFSLAKYANDSYTIKQLVNLGVKLYKLDADRELAEMILTLDFDRDVKPYLEFLRNCGVPPENFGNFITRNPRIFKEDMDDLHTRIRYLRAHLFTPAMIQVIVNKNPVWLSFKTQDIDYKLGYFQHNFKLNGFEMRCVTVKCPKLITTNMDHIKENTFALKEEMGFSQEEMQLILMKSPRLWILSRHKVLNAFIYAHRTMKLSHEIISKQPQIMQCRRRRLQRRHEFLVHLNRNQYDPKKPLYVSPVAIVTGTDEEFCQDVAKASIHTYNMFLKTK